MCADGEDCGGGRPSLRSAFTNWREYDAPFHTKFRMAMQNSWIKVRTRSNCCGNDGEPGC